MGRAPCCEKVGLNRGKWTAEEDEILTKYIQAHGKGSWRTLPKSAGLKRCGKSCRLRWTNYLRGDIKRGNITAEEEDRILRLHRSLGNRWSLIASHLPGRTDNEIKNYWNTHLSHLSTKRYPLSSSDDNNNVLETDTKCKRRDYGKKATPHVNIEIVEERHPKDLDLLQHDIECKSDDNLMHDMDHKTPPVHSESRASTSGAFIVNPIDRGKGIQSIEQQGKQVYDDEILLGLPDLDIDMGLLSLEKLDEFCLEKEYLEPNHWGLNSQCGDHDAISSPTQFYIDDLWGNWSL